MGNNESSERYCPICSDYLLKENAVAEELIARGRMINGNKVALYYSVHKCKPSVLSAINGSDTRAANEDLYNLENLVAINLQPSLAVRLKEGWQMFSQAEYGD